VASAESFWHRQSVGIVCLAAIMFTLVIGLRATGVLQGLELAIYDGYLASDSAQSGTSPSSRVAVLEITEDDINVQGHWPISDRILAEAIQHLFDAGARVVALDLYRDLPVAPGQEEFAHLLREESRIVAVRKFGSRTTGGIPGPAALAGTDRVGFNDISFDRDDTVRRALLYQDDGRGEVGTSFALRTAAIALALDSIIPQPDPKNEEWLRLGAATLRPFEPNDGGYVNEDAAGYQVMLDMHRARVAFETYGLTELIRGDVPPDRLRDRVIVIGANAGSLPDNFNLPVVGPIPGVQVHATIIDQLLRQAYGESAGRSVIPDHWEAGLILLCSMLGCGIGVAIRGGPALGLSTLAVVLVGGAAFLWYLGSWLFSTGVWVPMAAPMLAWTGGLAATSRWLSGREHAEREQLMQIFSRHVSKEIANEIWLNRDAFFKNGRPRPQRLTATVMFADMRGYTARAEGMEPEDLMDWSSEFIERMAALAEMAHGVVDDYFGDGIKVNFGVPIPRETEEEVAGDARRAVECALAMSEALIELNLGYRARGLPATELKIGIHTGPVVAGSIGSAGHLKYTVVGDVVVTAQRLESTTEVEHDFELSPCRILVSADTHAHAGALFDSEAVGAISLKGRHAQVEVYRIIGPKGE